MQTLVTRVRSRFEKENETLDDERKFTTCLCLYLMTHVMSVAAHISTKDGEPLHISVDKKTLKEYIEVAEILEMILQEGFSLHGSDETFNVIKDACGIGKDEVIYIPTIKAGVVLT